MKINRFAVMLKVTLNLFQGQHLLLGIIVLFPVGSVYAQGTQLLNNNSFENKKADAPYPTQCLYCNSGGGGGSFCGIVPIDDYFLRVADWTSHYHKDPEDCNPFGLDQYVHSPDWVGGNFPNCGIGWDQYFSTGMGAYEVIWQNFGGGLDMNKCYEVRIKMQIIDNGTNYHTLDVLMGSGPIAFYYKNDLLDYRDINGNCQSCDQLYGEYIVAPTEEIKTLKQFPFTDILALGSNPYLPYSFPWFELHAKIDMSSITFSFPSSTYKQFGLDVRYPNQTQGFCNSPYLFLDYIEFFESCPDHYEIFGAMIAGPQDEYIATNFIRAGFIDKGPAIVTSNGKTAFKAGHFIELVPGFLSDYGSVLEIVPENACDESGSCPRIKSLISNVTNPLEIENTPFNEDRVPLINSVKTESESSCNVYPNPGINTTSITVLNGIVLSITIIDDKGRTLNTVANIHKKQYILDISNLASGIYYLIVQTSENELFYKKLVKI